MPIPEHSPTKKRRGGQPGNTNALKHGYYSHRYRSTAPPPTNPPPESVLIQIKILREYIRSVKSLSDQKDAIHDQVSLLKVMVSATARLSRLLRLQRALGSLNDGEAARAAIFKALLANIAAREPQVLPVDENQTPVPPPGS